MVRVYSLSVMVVAAFIWTSGLRAEVSFQPIGDVLLLAGAPLHVPLDGFDTEGNPIVFTAVSEDETLVSPTIPEGNRSMRMDVPNYGEMTFELFEQSVPRVTEAIIGLAQEGTYDGVIFHRVIEDFVIQGGDPTGTGFGDPDIPDFDDQFSVDLQHSSAGVLSMAKTSRDDTNSSQFFITAQPTRSLDFNHSVFGHLTEGEDVRLAIDQVPTDDNDRPKTDIVMERVEIFDDTENSLLMLKAPEGATGQTRVTVTAIGGNGDSFSRTFSVAVQPDPYDGGPFLNELPPAITTHVGTPVDLPLTAVDVEGDPVAFDAVVWGPIEFDFTIHDSTPDDPATVVSITPPDGFAGDLDLLVGVRPVFPSNTGNGEEFDTQQIRINVVEPSVLKAGDADQDLDFDQLDLVKVQIAAKYLTGQPATWGEGDWNGAPEGVQGSPPPGNGFFDQLDIVAALANDLYLTGPYGALASAAPSHGATDEQASIVYNATFGSSFGSLDFDAVAQIGLSSKSVISDLTVVGSLESGGELGDVDLIHVPEPSAFALLVAAMAGVFAIGRRRM